ncbi:MAG: hypothetical protein Q7J80_14645, partial [Anaerolineales bacterium]|nr:hypothetical protein [Anaerolineales bacterium]
MIYTQLPASWEALKQPLGLNFIHHFIRRPFQQTAVFFYINVNFLVMCNLCADVRERMLRDNGFAHFLHMSQPHFYRQEREERKDLRLSPRHCPPH